MIFLKFSSIVVSLTLLLCGSAQATFYEVTDYGARGDGQFENAESIQKAINAASDAGGGVVLFPKGVYRTGTIFLQDNVTLHIERNAIIKGTPDYSLYPADIEPAYETFLLRKDRYAPRALIVAIEKENVAIEGVGVIDGNGEAPELKQKKRMDSINLIRFIKCKNVRIEGTGPLDRKLTITNAAHWAVQPIGVDGLVVRNVHIHNYGGETPDGLAICDSSNVLVEDCRVEADDDAITLKSGTPEVLIENIRIKHSTFVSRVCGFKIGPQTFGGFKNIHISDSHFEGATLPPGTQYDPHHGVFLNVGNGGFIDGVVVEDCTMANIPSPISIYLGQIDDEYWETYWPGKPENTVLGRIENITFRNITATNMGQFGMMLEGREERKLRNIRFENVSIESVGGGELKEPVSEQPGKYPNLIYLYDGNVSTWGLFMRHVDGVTLENLHLWTQAEDPRPDLYLEDVENFEPGDYLPQQQTVVNPRHWKPDGSSEFEVSTQIRAWTIRDEGMDRILNNMQQMCGVNNLHLIAVMHKEHRPYQAPEFPHNPVRDAWEAEDSRVTFFPDWERYGTIKPLLSDVDWVRETDWLQLMIDACRERDMAVGVEVSHFPIPQSLIKANPDWQQKQINGKVWKDVRICPNNPDVKEYAVALFGDLAANYDVEYIQTCQHLFFGNIDIDKNGTCFCEHCIAEAETIGFDLAAAIPILKENQYSQPERDNWFKLRQHSTTQFYRLIQEEIERVKMNPKCHLRYNDSYPYRGWILEDMGMHLDDVAPYLGSLVHQDHEEQKGRRDEDFARRKAWLSKNRRLLGPDMHLVCGIAPRIKATPELVQRGIKVALEHPAKVDGLAFKHYDGASFGLMRAFRQGMIDAGVSGLEPIQGKEVEAMNLEGFEIFDDYVEEWGAQTSDHGVASFEFEAADGVYDLRLTYFDEEKGHSSVKLFVGEKEVADFKLDKDVGCWDWQVITGIPIQTGTPIKLVVNADAPEMVRLDFLEFIPSVK